MSPSNEIVRNAVLNRDLHTVTADNGFQNWHSEYELYFLGVEPLIYYRGSSANALTNNALIRERDYTQRWMAETSYSSVKRSLGDAVRAHTWYREFREIVLMFAITNIEQLWIHSDPHDVPLFNVAVRNRLESRSYRVVTRFGPCFVSLSTPLR